MQFGTCFVGDLFCGPGKNGTEKGSPLLLIEIAKRVLDNVHLKKKHPNCHITILFNDQNKNFLDSLEKETSKLEIDEQRIKFFVRNLSFKEIITSEIINILRNKAIPKFFFLDPFNYSTIQLDELKTLIKLPFTEVLLFSPTFLAYRFKEVAGKHAKLKNFLDNFTAKGEANYKDVYDFIDSICIRLKGELNTELIRQIPIDFGRTKHTLFFITKHIMGMLIINSIFLKESFDGRSLCVKEIKNNQIKPPLFSKTQLETREFIKRMKEYQGSLEEYLKKEKKLTNKEIIYHSIACGWLPKYACELVRKLKSEGKVEYGYLVNGMKKGPYVSNQNWNKELCVVSYKKV